MILCLLDNVFSFCFIGQPYSVSQHVVANGTHVFRYYIALRAIKALAFAANAKLMEARGLAP